jgi:hypothetical protein
MHGHMNVKFFVDVDLILRVRQFQFFNLYESRQPSQLAAHSFQTQDIEAAGSLVTSTLFLYWYINLNKNLNDISFFLSLSLSLSLCTSERSRFCVVLLSVGLLILHVYLFVPECKRISNVS